MNEDDTVHADRPRELEQFVVGDKVYAPVGEKPITPWSAQVQLCYLRLPDSDEVYAIYCPFPEPFGTDPSYWKDPIVAAVPPDEIETIRYTYADEQFEVKLVNSIWMIESDARLEPASLEVVNALLLELRQIVTRDFPEEDELAGVDFAEPDAILGIGVREGVLVGVLQFTMPIELAILISLVARAWATIVDLLLVVGCFAYDYLSGDRILGAALRGARGAEVGGEPAEALEP